MTREIINPRWENDSKNIISAEFIYDDGRKLKASISIPEGGINPDWDEIIEKYGVEYLDQKAEDSIKETAKRKQQQADERRIAVERQAKEILFNAKAEAFDLDIVKNSTNREIKNKIRRANSIMEVTVYTTMLHMLEDPIANPANDTMDDTSTSANT